MERYSQQPWVFQLLGDALSLEGEVISVVVKWHSILWNHLFVRWSLFCHVEPLFGQRVAMLFFNEDLCVIVATECKIIVYTIAGVLYPDLSFLRQEADPNAFFKWTVFFHDQLLLSSFNILHARVRLHALTSTFLFQFLYVV
jgi:hypothetical protein